MIDFWPSFLILFKEAFEGVPAGLNYTWYVQGHEAIFDAFAKTSAEQASKRPGGANSIAAHMYHVKFALEMTNRERQGLETSGDWEGSWAKQDVTEEEWKALEADVRREYETMVKFFEGEPNPSSPDAITGTIAILPHMAYHLGAVRQLMKVA